MIDRGKFSLFLQTAQQLLYIKPSDTVVFLHLSTFKISKTVYKSCPIWNFGDFRPTLLDTLSCCVSFFQWAQLISASPQCTMNQKVVTKQIKFYLCKILIYEWRLKMYSELSDCPACSESYSFWEIFPPTCLIRTYTFIYFRGKFPPAWLLEPPRLLIFGKIPNYKIILSSFQLLFCCFKQFKVASKS